MTYGDSERREIAAVLRERAPETYVGLYEAVTGREIPLDTSGGEDARELCGRLADLIEPAPKCSEATPKCDREALLALACELDEVQRSRTTGIYLDPMEAARRIREACGEPR